MGSTWAIGKKAYGFCDRCGFRYDLKELREEYVYFTKTGLRTCPECWDPDHPQLRVGRWDVSDAESLRDPRPDNGQAASRRKFAWDPVGNLPPIRVSIGSVTVTTS